MKRKIIQIHAEKCNGCALCADACHENAIKMINGKATLISDEYCDGLGDCLPACPTNAIEMIEREAKAYDEEAVKKLQAELAPQPSMLTQWPIQLSLINPNANFLEGANLVIAADCVAFAYGNFHQDFIKGNKIAVGCPKLDDVNYYIEKLTDIFSNKNINSVEVVRMEVPCCGGIQRAVELALKQSNATIEYKTTTISIEGDIL